MPAKPGNRNALQHGAHSYLATGRLPKGGSYITRAMRCFRISLEKAVTTVHGEVSLLNAATIQTAIRHETVAQLAQRWLRLRFDHLGDAERLMYARQIAASSDARDKAIRSLGLDRADANRVIDVLYADDNSPGTAAPTTDEGDDDRTDA